MDPSIIQYCAILLCTLNSVTESGHIKYQENPLPCKLHGNSTWKIISFYLLYSHIPIIWHVFTRPVIMSLVHGISTDTKHDRWSHKSQKRDWPCILHGHSQSRYWECVWSYRGLAKAAKGFVFKGEANLFGCNKWPGLASYYWGMNALYLVMLRAFSDVAVFNPLGHVLFLTPYIISY